MSLVLKEGRHETHEERESLDEIITERLRLDQCSLGHPDRAKACRNLAFSLWKHYTRFVGQAQLLEAVDLEREVLSLCPPDHEDHALSCRNLAGLLRMRYEHTGDQQLLTETINLERSALALCPSVHPDHAISCQNLAVSLHLRYEHIGDQQLLTESIHLERSALALCPPGHTHRALYCGNLAASLCLRYEHTGDQNLLTESIDLQRSALSSALCPPDHSDHARSCRNLAASLRSLYGYTGDQHLLTESIDLERSALALCPPNHQDHARSCRNLAASLHLRYENTGDQKLLIESIDLERSALALCPPGHPDHARSCRNLAVSLGLHYEQTGDQQFLTESIDLLRRALALCPPGHPDHARSCRNLAASLRLRYEHTDDQQLLTESVHLERSALARCPPGHPSHAISCQNLAASLHLRYQRTGNQQLLEESIGLYQKSLVYCNPNTRWRDSMGLAWIYLETDSSVYDVIKSTQLLTDSLQSKLYDSIPNLVSSAIGCLHRIWKCKQLDPLLHISLGHIYQRLAVLLPLLPHPACGPQAQLEALESCRDVGADACIDAVISDKGSSGIEMLELMQGLVWSQKLHRRDPQLDHIPVHLATQLKACLHTLNQPTLSSGSSQLGSALKASDIHHDTSIQAQAVIENIRDLPGLERFMLGESFDSLCAVATTYPAVVLVYARGYSYALIITSQPCLESQIEDRCSVLQLDLTAEEIIDLSISPALIRQNRGSEVAHESQDFSGGRGIVVAPVSPTWRRQMKMMWDKIVYPVLAHLKLQLSRGRSRPRLYWCPTGAFSRLPLHAAGIYGRSRGISCSDYVVSTYAPTLTSLLRAQNQAPKLTRENVSLALVAEKLALEPGLIPIPQVDIELEQVSVAAERVQVKITHRMVGFTEVGTVATAIQAANIIHLACHGVQDARNATQSGFCLGDGRLTIEHLMDLSVPNPFLAFLSACETAKGDTKQPDQVMHLAAAMLFCGFKGVIATMWAICDLDGPEVAKWFYEELFANDVIDVDTVAYGLDATVGKLRNSGVPPDRWAPFIHMGA